MTSAFLFTPSRNSSLLASAPTLVPYNFTSFDKLLAVSTVVIVAVNVEIITRPTKIQAIPNTLAKKERGALSPYLRGNKGECFNHNKLENLLGNY